MAHYYATNEDTGAGFVSRSYVKVDGSTVPSIQTQPAVTGRDVKPCLFKWKKRLFDVGRFSRAVIRCEDGQAYMVGMSAPEAIPVVVASAGNDGIGSDLPAKGRAYFAFRHRIGTILVAESNPGEVSVEFDLIGGSRNYQGFPTVDPEGRATHVVVYLKVDEALAREDVEVPLGATNVTVNTPQGALGRAISFRRGVPPYCRFAIAYQNRTWWGGDTRFPWRMWYSEIDEPESIHSSNYVDTLGLEHITGLAPASSDQLAVFGLRVLYELQGYRGADFGVASDFRLKRVDPSIGTISHHSIENIHDRLWFAGVEGPAVFEGVPRYVCDRTIRDFFYEDFKANKAEYQRCWAVEDPETNVYKLCINNRVGVGTPATFYYVISYEDIEARTGAQQLGEPRVSFDQRSRQDRAAELLPADEGSGLPQLHTGSCDGLVRLENDAADPDDDGDAWLKRFMVQPNHDYFEDIGSDKNHGKTFVEFGLVFKNETNEATLTFYLGDDSAVEGTGKDKTIPVGATLGRVARGEYFMRPYLSGEGLSHRVTVLSPVGVEYAGYFGAWKEGLKRRLAQP